MEYSTLGNSGLQVSRFGLGAIQMGTSLNVPDATRMLGTFEDAGGNLIDTANIYGGGMRGSHTELAGTSERTVGKIIKGKRDRFIVATKGGWAMEDEFGPNGFGLSRAYLTKNIEASLTRLGTDYIDLYQCNCIDPYTPIEETMRVLDDFVRSGKIRYVGVSNWEGWQVVKANAFARANGLSPLVSNQIWYNLCDRSPEFSIIPACRDQQVAIIVWGALASTFLAARYEPGDMPGPDSSFCHFKEGEMCSWDELNIDRNWQTLDMVKLIANNRSKTSAQVALRWLMQSGTCEVLLVSSSSVERFAENLAASDFELTEKEMSELRQVSEPHHPYPHRFWDLFCYRDSPFFGGAR